ncbi:hypothetical protein BDU57DRAFT_444282 [Ampelomyces quisqualis]|uniref:TLC domain-containing protein n=1 Tax=Ampelomyces quisqualis TaxID=50730 RepID=A0A6A5QT13_AMPQU|nr:hypothetical protein BDU57DRAFT_444282 [Ampelomyces quisqualis]
MPNQEVSQLAPYAGLILVISLVAVYLLRCYFEDFFVNRMYGDVYQKLNDKQRRGFINHHIGATIRMSMLLFAAIPFFSILTGKATFDTRFGGSNVVTYGDILLVLNQVFIALYLFELIYCAKSSLIADCHHVGTVIIAAIAVFRAVNWEHHPDANMQFILSYVWGVFNVIFEFWPQLTIILYRVYANDHKFLSYILLSATIIKPISTIVQTIVVLYVWAYAWDRWTLGFKILVPIIHFLFTVAQISATKTFYSMWQRQKQKLQEKANDVEIGNEPSVVSNDTSDARSNGAGQKSQ